MYKLPHLVIACFLSAILACGVGPATETGDPQPDASPDASSEPPVGEGPTQDYIFDDSRLHHFELEVTPEDWQALRERPLLEQYVPATLIFQGSRYEDAAVRFKGDYNTLVRCFDDQGQQICPKLSIKVSFNEYGPGRFAGLRKLVFNSSVYDASLMREVLGYWLYRQMGIHAPRASHAQLTVNGERHGVFVLVEHIDDEFVKERWELNQGNLYKRAWPQHGAAEPYIEALQSNEEIADVSDMLAFKSLLDSTSDETFEADIAGTLDLGYMARFLAVDWAINNGDGARRFYCDEASSSQQCTNNNYYWYHEPGALFHLIPWDLDFTMGEEESDLGRSMWSDDCTRIPVCEFWDMPECPADTQTMSVLPTQCDSLHRHVHRATWNAYLAELARLAAGPLSAARVTPFLQAQRDKVRDAVAQDPFGPGAAAWQASNDWLDTVLALQRGEIEALLAEQP
jgi:spore coat protein H